MSSAVKYLLLSTAVLATGFGGGVLAQDASLMDRAHKGDVTVHGGARRLTGDITEAFKAEIKAGPAKNVILLIGDGMGDRHQNP